MPWSGDRPIQFSPNRRYLAVVAAIRDGYCAIYDTEADLLDSSQASVRQETISPGRPLRNRLNADR